MTEQKKLQRNKIYQGDVLEVLKTLPDKTVQCVITSPPYWGLRDYKTSTWEGGNSDCEHVPDDNNICEMCGAKLIDKQIGLEQSPDGYVNKMVDVFREIHRVLRDDGTVWLNIGDCYSPQSSHKGGTQYDRFTGESNWGERSRARDSLPPVYKAKDLVGIPWMLAFALRNDGWYLRSDIVWYKENSMPDSTTSRPTMAHEFIFLLSKSGDPLYWVHVRKMIGTRIKPDPDYIYIHRHTGEERATEPEDYLTNTFVDKEDGRTKKVWRRKNLWESRDYFYDNVAIQEPVKCLTRAYSKNHVDERKDAKTSQYAVSGKAQDAYYKKLAERIDAGEAVGKNKRTVWKCDDVWEITTVGYKEAHFAVMPEKVVEPCLLAGTSEHGSCPKCGAPYERVRKYEKDVVTTAKEEYIPNTELKQDALGKVTYTGFNARWKEKELKPALYEWVKTCDCEKATPAPCIVYDPFMGAATVGVVALKNGRDYVGSELNPEYIKIAEKRLSPYKNKRLSDFI